MRELAAVAAGILAGILFFGTCEAGDYRQCFVEAGRQYGIAPDLLEAMAKVESGYRPDAVNQNSDGSVDVGLLQINSFWYRSLGKQRVLPVGVHRRYFFAKLGGVRRIQIDSPIE